VSEEDAGRGVAFRSDRLGELIPPDFWTTMPEADRLHVLAVTIVASERTPALRELLLSARWELRNHQRPAALKVLKKRCQKPRT
jgi:hypothetical protein